MSDHKSKYALLMLGALGVVFGDIGTSPLYAFKECLKVVGRDPHMVYSVLSMIFWTVLSVVSIKYVVFVMKFDNKGEGGILSLTSLTNNKAKPKLKPTILLIGIIGAAMFYGDSMITPAISILSATEGLKLIDPHFEHVVIPLAILIVCGLFWVQKRGTQKIGTFFGPFMLVWFTTLAALGAYQTMQQHFRVLNGLNPLLGWEFAFHHPKMFFVVMGAVFLTVTGGEALYADMGHFGKKPIQKVWLYFVFPSLMLNYFGQGALVLNNPTVEDAFFELVSPAFLLPMVILSIGATIIASQAVISGAYSLTRQAIHMGYLPRLRILHTSSTEMGQIYIPFINSLLFMSVIFLIVSFKNADSLANAYGIAVAATMMISTVLLFFMNIKNGRCNRWCLLFACFIVLDAMFIYANIGKIPAGGWFPLSIGVLGVVVMTTWKRGKELVLQGLAYQSHPLAEYIDMAHDNEKLNRVDGCAVFLSSLPNRAPSAFVKNVQHNKVIHKQNIFLSFVVTDEPYVPNSQSLEITHITHQCWSVIAKIGFKETPDALHALCLMEGSLFNWNYNPSATSFYLSRENIVADRKVPGMSYWREKLYVLMSKNAVKAADYFNLPLDKTIEIGTQVKI